MESRDLFCISWSLALITLGWELYLQPDILIDKEETSRPGNEHTDNYLQLLVDKVNNPNHLVK